MDITITINCDNAAFSPRAGYEVARILRRLANEFSECNAHLVDGTKLRDINGNTVGIVKVEG
jgi:hypothetical protein